jgi:prepilin-type N-terminal cleavage/methylation domain-containing protein
MEHSNMPPFTIGRSAMKRRVCRVDYSLGFTLTEVMIAMAIMATILSIATWGIGSWIPGIQLKAAARSLKSDMHAARMTAVQQNTFVVSQFDTMQNRYAIFVDDGAGNPSNAHNYLKDGGEVIIRNVQLHPHLNIISAQFGAVNGTFAFNSRGATDGLAGGIYMNNTKNSYRGVTISRIGKITVQASNDGRTWQPVK